MELVTLKVYAICNEMRGSISYYEEYNEFHCNRQYVLFLKDNLTSHNHKGQEKTNKYLGSNVRSIMSLYDKDR